jgi:uncharacterized membrane protein
VEAGEGCGLAFIAGVLAFILNLKRWQWWLFLSLAAFISCVYITFTTGDI